MSKRRTRGRAAAAKTAGQKVVEAKGVSSGVAQDGNTAKKALGNAQNAKDDPYRLVLPPCIAKDHAKRKNCVSNPNCVFGLGEKKQALGIWMAKPKILKGLPSADADQFRDLKSGKPCGLQNLGATCYVNALLQCLFMNDHFRKAVYACDKSIVGDNAVVQELRLVFAKLEMSKEKSQSLKKLTSLLGLHTGIQQDATEFTKLFLSYLESRVKGATGSEKTVESMLDMFRGKQKNVTRCDHCKAESVRASPFYELALQLKAHPTLESSIREYGKVEQLKGLNQYLCNTCKCKRDADRFCKIAELPSVLNLQLMRFIFDLKLFAKKKVKDALEIPKHIDFKDFEDFVEVAPGATSTYSLVAVLHHKGSSAFHGHYTADLFDPHLRSWWTFDDETVSAMAEDASSNARPNIHGSAGSRTAYMLVYMRDDVLASKERCKLPRDLRKVVEEENKRLDEKLKLNKRAVVETEKRIKERKKQYAEVFLDPENPPYAQDGKESFLISKEWLQRWINGEPLDIAAKPTASITASSEDELVDLSNDMSLSSPKPNPTETINLADSPTRPSPPDAKAAQSCKSNGMPTTSAAAKADASVGAGSKRGEGSVDGDFNEVKQALQAVIQAIDPDAMEIDLVDPCPKSSQRTRETSAPVESSTESTEPIKLPSRVNPRRRAKDTYKSEKAIEEILEEDRKRLRKEQGGAKKKRLKDGPGVTIGSHGAEPNVTKSGSTKAEDGTLGRQLWLEPIKQGHLRCEHSPSTLSPDKMKLVKRISRSAWKRLLDFAGGADAVFSSKDGYTCEVCVKKLFEDERKVVEDSSAWEHIAVVLQNQYPPQNADEELGIISRKWVAKFKTMHKQRETLLKKDKTLTFDPEAQKVNIFSRGLANYADLVPDDMKDLSKQITCEHGNLRPGKSGKRMLSMKDLEFIKNNALQGSCKDSRVFTTKSEVCQICTDKSIAEKEAEMEYRKERDEQLKSKEYGSILRKLSKRTSGHPNLVREMNHLEGGVYYIVPCAWFSQWRLYVKEGFQIKPPSISEAVRDTLLCDHRRVRVSPRLIQWLEGERTRAMQLLDPQTFGDHGDECEIVTEKEWKALLEFNSISRRPKGVMVLLCDAETWEEGERRKFEFQPELCTKCMQQRKELHSLALSHFENKTFEFIRLLNGQTPPDAEEKKSNMHRRSKRSRGGSKSKYSVSVSSTDKISLVKLKLWEVLNSESVNVNDIRVYRKGKSMDGESTIGGNSIKVGERLYFDTLLKGDALDAYTEADILSSAVPNQIHTREVGFSGTALTLS